MKFILTYEDDSVNEIYIKSLDISNVCRIILEQSKNHSTIKDITAKETYVIPSNTYDNNRNRVNHHSPFRNEHMDEEDDNDVSNRFNNLKDTIETLQPFIDVKVMITKKDNHFFDISFSGNILDILGIISLFNISSLFETSTHALNTDISLTDYLLRGNEFRYHITQSLILRFAAKESGNLNLQTTYDILRNEINKQDLKKYISIVFHKIYSMNIEDAKIIEDTSDKLSMKSILNSKIKELDTDIGRILLGDPGDGNE
jgi:hypothetical protein